MKSFCGWFKKMKRGINYMTEIIWWLKEVLLLNLSSGGGCPKLGWNCVREMTKLLYLLLCSGSTCNTIAFLLQRLSLLWQQNFNVSVMSYVCLSFLCLVSKVFCYWPIIENESYMWCTRYALATALSLASNILVTRSRYVT